jgi:hypothetical protein
MEGAFERRAQMRPFQFDTAFGFLIAVQPVQALMKIPS